MATPPAAATPPFHLERADGTPPSARSLVDPWASVAFNLGGFSPSRDASRAGRCSGETCEREPERTPSGSVRAAARSYLFLVHALCSSRARANTNRARLDNRLLGEERSTLTASPNEPSSRRNRIFGTHRVTPAAIRGLRRGGGGSCRSAGGRASRACAL